MSGPPTLPADRGALNADGLVTASLDARSRRRPLDAAQEYEALQALARTLSISEAAMLQQLADTALELCGADSSGVSQHERDVSGGSILRWVAVSGRCSNLVGQAIPCQQSPCGVTIELGVPQLFDFPKRQFACLSAVAPEITEELVVPMPGGTGPLGALWVMSHGRARCFDSEHRRILTGLAHFACAALTTAAARAEAEARASGAEAARNALSEAQADKDRFIATLGHELRGPLAPIDNALQAAQRLAAGSGAVLSALAVASRQVQQLKRLVSDLLDASRVRHGKLSIQPDRCLLGDIVRDAVAAVSAEVGNLRHQLHVMVPSHRMTVFADPARLTQVLTNLLMNAVKYTPAGGEITLRVDAPDPATIPANEAIPLDAMISVKDNGIGIAPELLPHVFDLFSQAPSACVRSQSGLGLGLSVVRHLVNAHRGEVNVYSEGEGKGTEVMLRLPIVTRDAVSRADRVASTVSPARVLLVDDNEDATEALAMLLALDGHEVKCAHSGEQALLISESFTPDVALIDLRMPDMDGAELARRLRQQASCSATRLVALTGVNPEEREGWQYAFDRYLVKPPSLEELAEVLRR
ncbi:hybrid sensor histidine kinase/response regulator [Paraburkholderia azotifigens]|uniref:histidine kinase n=1 Tax=Paraburkholderia azotifigens TaxID=2057004 RepID=A0ABU9R2Y8_9BURK